MAMNDKKKKKMIMPIIISILMPILIAGIFFGILSGILEIIAQVIKAIVDAILNFFSAPLDYLAMWGDTIANRITQLFGRR